MRENLPSIATSASKDPEAIVILTDSASQYISHSPTLIASNTSPLGRMDIVTTSEFEEEISLQSEPAAFDIYATYQHILQNEEVRLKVASIARHDLKDAYV